MIFEKPTPVTLERIEGLCGNNSDAREFLRFLNKYQGITKLTDGKLFEHHRKFEQKIWPFSYLADKFAKQSDENRRLRNDLSRAHIDNKNTEINRQNQAQVNFKEIRELKEQLDVEKRRYACLERSIEDYKRSNEEKAKTVKKSTRRKY
jgi:hypothetical protein